MKKIILTFTYIFLIILFIITTINLTYCFSEYGKEVEITFETNGGNKLENFKYTYEYGNLLTKIPTPQKEGYKFNGWYLDNKLENKLIEMPIPYIKENKITLYAKWESKTKNDSYVYGVLISGLILTLGLLLIYINKNTTNH